MKASASKVERRNATIGLIFFVVGVPLGVLAIFLFQ
jgi:hypothetical protein